MLKLAVVGRDVSASDSPDIHAFLLKKMGTQCGYDRVSVPPAEFSARAEALFRTYDAFNVTIPFKGEIMPYLCELDGEARRAGAVNTVVSRGRKGYNTDGLGFLAMLEGEGIAPAGKTALVLGAGGAGRSCIRKLCEAGATVSAYESDEERLFSVYGELGGFTPLCEVPLMPFDLIVNCTGVGMHETEGKTPVLVMERLGARPAGEELISLCGAAVDLIYAPAQSEFLRIAASLGKQTVNGAAMLFYQAYFADCIFTGRAASAAEAKTFWEEWRIR